MPRHKQTAFSNVPCYIMSKIGVNMACGGENIRKALEKAGELEPFDKKRGVYWSPDVARACSRYHDGQTSIEMGV